MGNNNQNNTNIVVRLTRSMYREISHMCRVVEARMRLYNNTTYQRAVTYGIRTLDRFRYQTDRTLSAFFRQNAPSSMIQEYLARRRFYYMFLRAKVDSLILELNDLNTRNNSANSTNNSNTSENDNNSTGDGGNSGTSTGGGGDSGTSTVDGVNTNNVGNNNFFDSSTSLVDTGDSQFNLELNSTDPLILVQGEPELCFYLFIIALLIFCLFLLPVLYFFAIKKK